MVQELLGHALWTRQWPARTDAEPGTVCGLQERPIGSNGDYTHSSFLTPDPADNPAIVHLPHSVPHCAWPILAAFALTKGRQWRPFYAAMCVPVSDDRCLHKLWWSGDLGRRGSSVTTGGS